MLYEVITKNIKSSIVFPGSVKFDVSLTPCRICIVQDSVKVFSLNIKFNVAIAKFSGITKAVYAVFKFILLFTGFRPVIFSSFKSTPRKKQ